MKSSLAELPLSLSLVVVIIESSEAIAPSSVAVGPVGHGEG
jgi:hypothetical protein